MDISLDINQTAVIVVDLQGDFTLLQQGSLAVENTGRDYVDRVVSVTEQLRQKGMKIFATQDFHPENHLSFYTRHKDKAAFDVILINGKPQVLWPPHCVQGTRKADILMDKKMFTAIIPKGTDPEYDSYSGFFDDNGASTGLEDKLSAFQVKTLIIFGLATDYCVRATAMDAVESGFKVWLIEDLCRGVAHDTTRTAIKEMKEAGISILNSDVLLSI